MDLVLLIYHERLLIENRAWDLILKVWLSHHCIHLGVMVKLWGFVYWTPRCHVVRCQYLRVWLPLENCHERILRTGLRFDIFLRPVVRYFWIVRCTRNHGKMVDEIDDVLEVLTQQMWTHSGNILMAMIVITIRWQRKGGPLRNHESIDSKNQNLIYEV